MRIFVLEDNPSRIAWFVKRFIGHDVTYADSCTQVDRYVPPYDLVCLDHDLGGRQMEEHEDDGSAFVTAIVLRLRSQGRPPVIVIHSFNEFGALRMQQTIGWLGRGVQKAFIAPFMSDFFKSILNSVTG